MRLPVGQSDFRQIIESDFDFVDKTPLIKEIIQDDQIILITRPRRFGKTLNLSMLHHFFAAEINGKSTGSLFDQLQISKETQICAKHQGKYPVISFSFKDVKESTYTAAYAAIFDIVTEAYDKHDHLLQSKKLSKADKTVYQSILDQTAKEIHVKRALRNLIKYLNKHYESDVVVLIDEYDTPIQSGYLHKFYEKIVQFFRIFFGAGLKDNPLVFKAVLTGILRVSKENLFSGLNNLVVYSMLNQRYGEYFGFTEPEVENLLKIAKLEKELTQVKQWYNGYCVGRNTLYNPWSIASYLKEKILMRYWVNTSDNALIKQLMLKTSLHFKQQLESLFQNKPLEKIIDTEIVFADLKESEGAIWSLLFMSGYLKSISTKHTDEGAVCQILIPNREVRSLYQQIIVQWLADGKGSDWYKEFLAALLCGDMEVFEERLGNILLQTISYHDVAKQPEAFYHGLMIGLTASLNKTKYTVKSNKESGLGRYDILIIPSDLQQLGIIIELKNVKFDEKPKELEKILTQEAKQALVQIDSKHYDSELKQHGLTRWLKIGLAFSGKHFQCTHIIEEAEQGNHR